MGRNRVRSFIAQFSARDSKTPTPASSPQTDTFQSPRPKPDSGPDSDTTTPSPLPQRDFSEPASAASSATSPAEIEHAAAPAPVNTSPSSSPAGKSQRRTSRPLSMVQTYHPLVMDVNEETPPELQPIFTLLNSHSNKLYQEGYFLKLDDQDIRGKPNPDRTWTECFAQLVGTVLSLWDAAELDAAGEDGEVLPKFINLTDASIKMIESLPTRANDEQPLQNILSISTAGRNRYLLHFNSHHSLIQWTSGIRLAMFEHSTLQEAYTGALIAGKGKGLNNINIIMERARLPVQEWVRVRFGAGVPWRRCWCVIEPPSEKEYQKAQKDLKKRSPYDRSHAPVLKGEIRFYDTKKDAEKKKKHQRPIASITDAYSAYAIYPQSKALIDGSTLLKIEGEITIHSDPPSSTEGFVFIMPETPPAVSGFEILLRFLFPTWDTFGLYGRPGRLVASVLDPRSLMFAMPKHKRYGYLEILDVSGLILADGSSSWSEREWRKRLKELTGQRMNAMEEEGENHSRSASRNSKRLSYGAQNSASTRPRVGFAEDGGSVRSSRSASVPRPGLRNDSAPPDPNRERAPSAMAGHSRHSRNISDTQIGDVPSFGTDSSYSTPPAMRASERARTFASDLASTPERVSSEDDSPVRGTAANNLHGMQRMETPEPVNAPPAFSHGAGARPQPKPFHSAEMRRATSRLSSSTLSQLAKAGGLTPDAFPDDSHERHGSDERAGPAPIHTDHRGLAVQPQASANAVGMNANFNGSREVLTSPTNSHPDRRFPVLQPSPDLDSARKRSDYPAGNPSLAFRPRPHDEPAPSGSFPPGPQDAGMGHPPPHESYDGRAPNQPIGPLPAARRIPPAGPQQPPYLQGGSPPIQRKPLPPRSTSLPHDGDDAVSPVSPYSPHSNFPPLIQGQQLRRLDDDAASTASPDYASTRRSIDTQESVDRPRAGVLKTIGDDTAGASKASSDTDYKIPEVDFGRTINYGAPIIPGSKASSSSNASRGNDVVGMAAQSPRTVPPASGRKSPGAGSAYSHFHQGSDDTNRRSVVWQPGATIGLPTTDNVISPEQFVQQRAAATPLYSHQRSASGNTLTDFRAATPSSPYKRPGSRGPSHSRHSSAELLSSGRPVSQGTAAALSGGEVSSHLSAREQEHVARVTGSPLIALAGNKGPSPTQTGLVGAIEARERERAQMRQGIGGQAVAQAIDQRHREQHQQAQRAAQAAYAQQQSQFVAQQAQAGPQSPMATGMTGGGAPSTYTPSMAGMSPRSMSPGPGMMGPVRFGQGFQPGPGYGPPQMMPQQVPYNNGPPGAQGFPSGGYMGNMQHRPGPLPPPMSIGGGMVGRPQSPGFPLPPQGQYSPAGTPGGPRPGTPGRMQFHGQAF
ncbi:CCR4-NOT transcriptional complex subunit [Madurella fahalii]|uniref:CCR4-NOT transcriptional complex subunit n=1 Tax=Madurella fahalii TaxID=1157608 RepID=A0ABQ0G0J5_9PEZI